MLPFVVAAHQAALELLQLYELTEGDRSKLNAARRGEKREEERGPQPLRHFVDQKLNLFAAIKSHFRGRCHKFCQFLRLRFTVLHI